MYQFFPYFVSISFVYQQILWHSFSIWKISKTNTIKFSGCHGPQKIKSWHKKLICTWLSQPVFTINHFRFYWTNIFNLTAPKYKRRSCLKRLLSHKVKKTRNKQEDIHLLSCIKNLNIWYGHVTCEFSSTNSYIDPLLILRLRITKPPLLN